MVKASTASGELTNCSPKNLCFSLSSKVYHMICWAQLSSLWLGTGEISTDSFTLLQMGPGYPIGSLQNIFVCSGHRSFHLVRHLIIWDVVVSLQLQLYRSIVNAVKHFNYWAMQFSEAGLCTVPNSFIRVFPPPLGGARALGQGVAQTACAGSVLPHRQTHSGQRWGEKQSFK